MRIRPLRYHRRTSPGRMSLLVLEWLFVLAGLIGINVYIWVNASTVLYQAYEDWAFDQRLRALTPSPLRFTWDEMRLLLGRDRAKAEPSEPPLLKGEPALGAKPPESNALDTKPLPRSAVIGRLEIPNLHLSAMVREGADAATLRRAVGHIPGTALPGRMGNVGLAGHRDTFFRALRNIQKNDAIEFQTEKGTYRYLVESTRIVGPRDILVLTPSGGANLTLVTCYPFYYVGSAPKRFIVRAALVLPPAQRLATRATAATTR